MRTGDNRHALCRRFKQVVPANRNQTAADKRHIASSEKQWDFTHGISQKNLGRRLARPVVCSRDHLESLIFYQASYLNKALRVARN